MTSTLKSQDSENKNSSYREGPVAKAIEKRTAQLPSDIFLWSALGSIGASLTLQLLGKKEVSTFIGQWAPTFLLLGLYNKIVKVAGSDRNEKEEEEQGKTESFRSQTAGAA